MEVVLKELGNLGFDWRVAFANTVNFAIIFFLLKHFFFGKIGEVLNERREKIQKGLENAALAEQNLKIADEEKNKIIKDANLESSNIIKGAEMKAKEAAIAAELVANHKASEIIKNAEGSLSIMKKEYEADLSNKLPQMAISMVEKILEEKMTVEDNNKYLKKILG